MSFPKRTASQSEKCSGPWLIGTTKVYPGVEADIVMESITLKTPADGRTDGASL